MEIRKIVLRSLVLALVVGISFTANSSVWAQGNYDRDICKELEPMAAELKKLQKARKIKRHSKSEFSKSEWLPSISTLWALKDKLRDRAVGLGDKEPSSLGYFLTHSAQPSSTGLANPYVGISKEMRTHLSAKVKAAASYEMALAQRIVSSKRKLKPADVFAMAVWLRQRGMCRWRCSSLITFSRRRRTPNAAR